MEWKVIQQFPCYEVSDNGQIRNSKSQRVLKPNVNNAGYYYVTLMRDGEKCTERIHQLVAQEFVDGYEEGLEIDHINRDKLDNRAANLRWITRSGNQRNTKRSKRVLNESTGLEFGCMAEAAEWLVVNGMSKNMHSAQSSLYCCLKGKTRTCAKMEWRYIDE